MTFRRRLISRLELELGEINRRNRQEQWKDTSQSHYFPNRLRIHLISQSCGSKSHQRALLNECNTQMHFHFLCVSICGREGVNKQRISPLRTSFRDRQQSFYRRLLFTVAIYTHDSRNANKQSDQAVSVLRERLVYFYQGPHFLNIVFVFCFFLLLSSKMRNRRR